MTHYNKNRIKGLSFFLVLIMITACLSKEGMLTVITDPEGVEVWLDEQYIGNSPIHERKLDIGRYTLRLVDPIQQISTAQEIVIESQRRTVIEKALTPGFGTVSITSDPEEAEVYIETFLGKTPLVNDCMHPGTYQFIIKHPDKRYQAARKEITIPKEETVEISHSLQKTARFNRKALIRAVLGIGAIGGYVWAVIEQGNYKHNKAHSELLLLSESEKNAYKDKAHTAEIKRTTGILIGTLCVVGFEIVALF